MATRAAELVAGIIDRIEGRPYRTGRPPLPTIEVVETLRFLVRGGVRWRELRAAAGRACGSTLRRRLDEWSATALLRRVPVALVRMVRAGPGAAASWDVVVDSCPVRAKRGGELTGPNPTDRGKAGTEYHVIASTDGLPLGVVPSAADVHDTRLFPHLLRFGPPPEEWRGGIRTSRGRSHVDPFHAGPRLSRGAVACNYPHLRPAAGRL